MTYNFYDGNIARNLVYILGYGPINEADLAAEMAKSRKKACEERALCPVKHGDAARRSYFAVLRICPFWPSAASRKA